MSETKAVKLRIEYIDIFRAFGIILMIMGHIKFGGYFDKWIHAFHMPMFFFISGWFYRKNNDNIGRQIAKKMKTLLLPYIVFEFVQWIILIIFIPEYRNAQTILYILTENTYKIPIENGTYGISPIPGAMWFLTSIFFTEVIYIILNKIMEYNWRMNVVVLILCGFGMFAPTIFSFRLPWAIDAALVGMGFFHIARIIKGTRFEIMLNLKLWQTLVIGVLFSILSLICPAINMRTGNYGWYLPFLINAIGLIITGWNIAKYVDNLLIHRKILKWVCFWLKGVGKDSIVYLCLNQIVILSVTKVLYVVGINGILSKIPIFFITMIILFGFEKLILGTKLRVIVGK